MRTIWLFPGQGSQHPGMLAGLPAADRQLVTQVTGVELDDRDYRDSVKTQLAITILQMAQVDQLKKAGWMPTVVAGHSLGVFAAAYAANVISKADVLAVVKRRAQLMQAAYDPVEYGMGVILGLTRREVEDLVAQVDGPTTPVCASNQNAPTQVTVSGKKTAIKLVLELAQQQGATKAKLLNVPVLSHTPLLAGVAEQLATTLHKYELHSPQALYLANYNGHLVHELDPLAYDLSHNLAYPVYWDTMMDVATELDLQVAVELCPGTVLSKLLSSKCHKIKRIPLAQYGIDDGLYLLDKWQK